MTLPVKLAALLDHLPEYLQNVRTVRVHTNKDTAEAARIVQRWRTPMNPISQSQLTASAKADFIIGTPYADRGTLKISQLLKEDRDVACLHPTSLINQIPVENSGINKEVAEKLRKTRKIVLSNYNLTCIINLPDGDDVTENMIFLIPSPLV